jgi:ABC-type multidrug transport system ATPase subunit
VLYNLGNQQILAFDEITSGLDDETALKVLKFICNYCQRNKKRIIVLASHQTNVTKSVCNKEIIFESNPPYSVVKCFALKSCSNI